MTLKGGFIRKRTLIKRDWEVMGTFRVPHPSIRGKFWRFIKELQIREGMQVTLVHAYITRPQPHIHFLAAGHSRMGKTLADVAWPRWERRWAELSGLRSGAFDIRPIHDAKGAVRYVFGPKNIKGDADSETSIYNRRLCRKISPTWGER